MARVALVHNHVGGKAGGGGGVRLMLELGSGLEALGHRVTVVCHDYAPEAEFDALSSVLDVRAVRVGEPEWVDARSWMARRYWQGMRDVAALVPDDVDVVNAHEWPGLRAGRLAARRLGVPFVWTRNDETSIERAVVPDQAILGDRRPRARAVQGLIGLPDLIAARKADRIVVLSSGQVRMVRASYRRGADIVPLGPSAQFFDAPDRAAARRRLGVRDEAFLAVGAAILFPHRRFEDAIEAVALLDGDTAIELLIVGSDHADRAYADRLAELIAQRGVGDRVRMPRRTVSDAELLDAYAAADVFLFPNQNQTWGLAPLEALAAGTPVIVSSGAGVHEVLVGRPGVQIVPPERPDALAAALRAAHSGEGVAGIEQTREWLRLELTPARYAERMADIFASLGAG